jgi:hypothetical protein
MSNNIRFRRVIVKFTQKVEVDGYETPDGEYRVGVMGAAKALGFAPNWLSRALTESRKESLKALQELGFTGEIIEGKIDREVGRGSSLVDTISVDDFLILARYAASQGKENAFAILGIPTPKQRKTKTKPELVIQVRLSKTLGGQREVSCPAGKIDLVTEREIIEVKNASDWKGAIGQVLVYGEYFPTHRKRIYLFGQVNAAQKRIVEWHCKKLGIDVSFDGETS